MYVLRVGRKSSIMPKQISLLKLCIPSLLTALQPVFPFAQFAPVSFEFPVEHNEQALVCCQAVIHKVGIFCDRDVGGLNVNTIQCADQTIPQHSFFGSSADVVFLSAGV
jgi:hypothetical protein